MRASVLRPGLARMLEHARAQAKAGPAWLVALRERAIGDLEAAGLPTVAQEDWTFTDVGPIAAADYAPDAEPSLAFVAEAAVQSRPPDLGGPTVLFAGGTHHAVLDRRPQQRGLTVTTAAERLRRDPRSLEAQWTAEPDANPFGRMNDALATDGLVVDVAPGTVVERPIHLIHVAAGAPRTSTHLRNLVRVGRGAQVTVVETYVSFGDGPFLTNPTTQLRADEGAHVEHVKLQLESTATHHVGSTFLTLGRDATVIDHSYVFGGALTRHDLRVRFTAPGGDATLNGLYVVGGSQHVDHHTWIDHAVPRCTSNELYKGILDDQARGVFYGKVLIRRDAQKSNASQTNKNLLLSKGALVDSIPALEILADDVKAAHGSTIGQLDPNHLFYLRSRGIDEATARGLLTYAFARDVVQRVKHPTVAPALASILLSRLPQGSVVREVLHEVEA